MKRPLRVAHVVATVGATGVESHLQTLLPGFDPTEVEPVLVAPHEGPLTEKLRKLDVTVVFGAPRRKLAFQEAFALSHAWKDAFDIVHAHGSRAMFWAEWAARRARVPHFVATVHELRWQTLQPGWKRELWIALENRALDRADRLITVSEATRRDLVARRPGLAERTHVVHGSAPILMNPDSLPMAGPATSGGPLRLVTIGRFDWAKGYDVLFDALGELMRRDVEFSLDVVGEGELESEVRAHADRLGIGERVRWLGGHVDLPATLARADAFVAASRTETFGIAALEAMTLGLPVLAPATGSLPEVVGDGIGGRLVSVDPPTAVPERLADVLAEWSSSPDERARLGAAGARRARDQFSPAALARGVTEVYRSLAP